MDPENEDLELDAALEEEQPEAEEGEEQGEGEPEDEYSIEIDGEEPEAETDLVKHLRSELRERDRRLASHEKASAPKVEVGERPTLEGCDWDEEKHAAELEAWFSRKRQAEAQEAEASKAAEAEAQRNQQNFLRYQSKLAALPLPETEKQAAQDKVVATLPHVHQAVIIQYADDPAKVVLALAKHPAMLDAIAAEPDPIKVAKAIFKMEGKLKVVNRKKPPAPESETIQRGSAPLSASNDKKLAQLEKQANISGDRTALIAYRKQLRAKAA